MKIRYLAVAALFFLATTGPVRAQKMQKAIVATPSISLNQFPVYVALEKGFYRQENLDVLVVVMDGTIAARALMAGDVDYLLAFATGVSVILNGAPLKGVLGITKKGTAGFMVRPTIISGADLKGKIIGVSGFGGEIYHFVLEVLQHYGLNPKQDVSILNVGNSALRLAALRYGKIDAAVLNSIQVRRAEEAGLKRLISAADLNEFPSNGVIVTTRKLKEQPNQVRGFVKATLKGVAYFKNNRDEMVAFLAKKLVLDTKDAEEQFQLGLKVFSDDGKFSEESLKRLVLQRDAKALERVSLTELVDWSFLPR
ncbi:MAG: ABC transporter substrate-binding protein [Deltaproteobacteria bacterium]|nr:ABC transporter substrate-binding protein [Deltaproteobacteria bacterium]